jgi:hypothetical protein
MYLLWVLEGNNDRILAFEPLENRTNPEISGEEDQQDGDIANAPANQTQ